jgi:hypothetical protein
MPSLDDAATGTAVISLVLAGRYDEARSLVALHPDAQELAYRTAWAAMLLLHDLDVQHGGSGRGTDLAVLARAACLEYAADLARSIDIHATTLSVTASPAIISSQRACPTSLLPGSPRIAAILKGLLAAPARHVMHWIGGGFPC